MGAIPRPADTKLYGRDNFGLALAVAALDAPKLSELSATTGLDITDTYFQDGTAWPEQETATTEAPRRGGDTVVFSSIGDTTYGTGTLIYAAAPQAAAGSDGRKLLELIPEGAERVLWERPGIAKTTDLAVDQVTHLWVVEFGPSAPTRVGEGAGAVAAAKATFVVRRYPAFWKKIVAG